MARTLTYPKYMGDLWAEVCLGTRALRQKLGPRTVCSRRAVLKGKKKKRKGLETPTATNVHGDALCFMVMGPFVLQRSTVGGWRRLVVCGWRLVAVGGWRSLGAVLKQKRSAFLRTAPRSRHQRPFSAEKRALRRHPPKPLLVSSPSTAHKKGHAQHRRAGGGGAPGRDLDGGVHVHPKEGQRRRAIRPDVVHVSIGRLHEALRRSMQQRGEGAPADEHRHRKERIGGETSGHQHTKRGVWHTSAGVAQRERLPGAPGIQINDPATHPNA